MSQGAEAVHSVDDALALDPSPWIIGGAQLYAATIARADRLEVTEIATSPDGDAHAPAVDPSLWRSTSSSADLPWSTSRTGLDYRFVSYSRR